MPMATPAVINERIKLLASSFDRVGTTCIAVGAIGPITATSLGTTSVSYAILAMITSIWVAAALIFHGLAHWLLGKMI